MCSISGGAPLSVIKQCVEPQELPGRIASRSPANPVGSAWKLLRDWPAMDGAMRRSSGSSAT